MSDRLCRGWLLGLVLLAAAPAMAAKGPKKTMEDPAKLAAQADGLADQGKWEQAMPLALRALDLHAGEPTAIDVLQVAAVGLPERWSGELLKRLAAAGDKAKTPTERLRWRWEEASCAAYFHKLDRLRQLVANGSLDGPDPETRAALGSLLIELGKTDQAEHILAATAGPLATYHRARLLAQKGDAAGAKKLLEGLPTAGDEGVFRQIGLVSIALRSKDAAPARAFLAEREKTKQTRGKTPLKLKSEILLLMLQVDLAEGNRKDAEWAGQLMSAYPATIDPSAILRASAVLPLVDLSRARK